MVIQSTLVDLPIPPRDPYVTFICSSSSMSLRSAGELAATAFFGWSFTTEAFFAKLQVENVYAWYFTSGRMAQNR